MPGGNCCAFRGCPSRSGHGISLFSFPKDPEQAKLWLKACYRSDLVPKARMLHNSSYRLCEVHFEEKFISKGSSKKRLFTNAIPLIFFAKTNDETENTSKSTEEEASEGSKRESHEESKKKASVESEGSKRLQIFSGPSRSKNVICAPLNIEGIDETNIPSPLISPSAATQTPLQFSLNTLRKRKIKDQLRSLQKDRKTVYTETDDRYSIDEFKKMCDVFLDYPINEIVKSHVTLKKGKGD